MNIRELKTKKALIAYIKEQLGSNPRWAVKGLVAIYNRESHSTHGAQVNGVGFSKYDAEFLCEMAEKVPNGLSENQLKAVMRIMPRYARQLNEIARF